MVPRNISAYWMRRCCVSRNGTENPSCSKPASLARRYSLTADGEVKDAPRCILFSMAWRAASRIWSVVASRERPCAPRTISDASNAEKDSCDMIVLQLLERNCPEPLGARRSASGHGSRRRAEGRASSRCNTRPWSCAAPDGSGMGARAGKYPSVLGKMDLDQKIVQLILIIFFDANAETIQSISNHYVQF